MTPSLMILLGGIDTYSIISAHLHNLKKAHPNLSIYECYKCSWYVVEKEK